MNDKELERPRLRQFLEKLASRIPCDPEEVRQDLLEKGLPELLGCWVNWRDRHITPRRRRVYTWSGFWAHGSAQDHLSAIRTVVEKIEAGDDLRPLLSDLVDIGYVRPKVDKENKRRGPEWRDKDYALTAFDTHHLHLVPEGTEELLYVTFSQNDALLVMFGGP